MRHLNCLAMVAMVWVSVDAVSAAQTDLRLFSTEIGRLATNQVMEFPVSRSGDLAFDTVLNYYTVDGSAVAGTDYIGVDSSMRLAQGMPGVFIPVTIAGRSLTVPTNQFLLVASAVGIGPPPQFGNSTTFAAAEYGQSLTVVDINGDGLADLVAPGYNGSPHLAIALNQTPPASAVPVFAATQFFDSPSDALSVAAADLNGDGKPDLVVSDSLQNSVSVFINATPTGASTATFLARVSFASGAQPEQIATGDFNGDGKVDIAVTNFEDQTFSVLINATEAGSASPQFLTHADFATPHALGIAVSDLNGDGKPDAVIFNAIDETTSVFFNTSNLGAAIPTFGTPKVYPTGYGTIAVTIADFDNDGRPDIAVGSVKLSILRNETPLGSPVPLFVRHETSFNGGFYVGSAKDINGDGKIDVLAASGGGSELEVCINQTPTGGSIPSFAPPVTFSTGPITTAIAVADLNGDGRPDVATVDSALHKFGVLLNFTLAPTADLEFSVPRGASGLPSSSMYWADFNADGISDLVTVQPTENNASFRVNATQAGAGSPDLAESRSFPLGEAPASICISDFDLDGSPDLASADSGDGTVSLILNDTLPGSAVIHFMQRSIVGVGAGPRSIGCTDLNGDGRSDFVVTHASTGMATVRFNTTPAGSRDISFSPAIELEVGTSPLMIVESDLNGDGRADLAVVNHDDNAISILVNTTPAGAGQPSFSERQIFPVNSAPSMVAVEDMNGDGKKDIIVLNETNGFVVLFNSTIPGSTTAALLPSQSIFISQQPSSLALEDLDGDGRKDVVIGDSVTGNLSIVINRTVPGSSTFNYSLLPFLASGVRPVSVGTLDVNHDGRPDLVALDRLSGSTFFRFSTQYLATLTGSPATGTIVTDPIFANGFD